MCWDELPGKYLVTARNVYSHCSLQQYNGQNPKNWPTCFVHLSKVALGLWAFSQEQKAKDTGNISKGHFKMSLYYVVGKRYAV